MVEHNLAKVGVASSNLVSRSNKGNQNDSGCLFLFKIQSDIDDIFTVLLLLLIFCSSLICNDNAQSRSDNLVRLQKDVLRYT